MTVFAQGRRPPFLGSLGCSDLRDLREEDSLVMSSFVTRRHRPPPTPGFMSKVPSSCIAMIVPPPPCLLLPGDVSGVTVTKLPTPKGSSVSSRNSGYRDRAISIMDLNLDWSGEMKYRSIWEEPSLCFSSVVHPSLAILASRPFLSRTLSNFSRTTSVVDVQAGSGAPPMQQSSGHSTYNSRFTQSVPAQPPSGF
jgi:hypothetical protein